MGLSVRHKIGVALAAVGIVLGGLCAWGAADNQPPGKGDCPKAAARSWSPEQATGEPNTPQAGDIPTAWASATSDGQAEWLLLGFEKPVKATAVHVVETYNPGALVRVTVFDPDGKEVEAWKGDDPVRPEAGMGTSNIPLKVNFPIGKVKLYLDSPKVPGWNEIDAVGLLGADEKMHWAKSAEASSSYADAWAPVQATGKPDTPYAGDVRTAWASATPDEQAEWLLLTYEKPVKAAAVQVVETYNPGALVRVTVFDPEGKEVEAWRGTDPVRQDAGMGTANIPLHVRFPIVKVKLYFDSPKVPGWNEIDAVGLLGTDEKLHWAKSAEASSSYADRRSVAWQPIIIRPVVPWKPAEGKRAWGPEQATGEPDTSEAGDIPTAWASRTPDDQPEWLLLTYDKPVKAIAVQVVETYNPGALVRVTVFDPEGKEVEVWKGEDPTKPTSEKGTSNIPIKVDFPVSKVKLYLDSPKVPGWNEIDAVGLMDTAEKLHWAKSAEASSTYADWDGPDVLIER